MMLKSLKIDLQPLGFKCFNLTANKSLMQYLVLSSYPQGANPKIWTGGVRCSGQRIENAAQTATNLPAAQIQARNRAPPSSE
jgi:hypothetical protein